MKEKIEEVQNYFKEKLLKGDFKIIEREQYTYIVSIDEEYNFSIWMKNDPECRKLYKNDLINFIDINLTDEESILLHNLLISDYNEFTEVTLVEDKKRAIEKLEREILKLKK